MARKTIPADAAPDGAGVVPFSQPPTDPGRPALPVLYWEEERPVGLVPRPAWLIRRGSVLDGRGGWHLTVVGLGYVSTRHGIPYSDKPEANRWTLPEARPE